MSDDVPGDNVESTEERFARDPSNTPIEDLVAPLDPNDDILMRLPGSDEPRP